MAERLEWVEIIEPRTKEHMYANLATGECVWDPPPGVVVKKTDDNQWWELFDQNTSRFYYYNATSQKTVWHRPQNCDIIPLAKLQTLKQNTEVPPDDDERRVKREISTQTLSTQPAVREHSRTASLRSSHSSSGTQTSPRHPRKHHHHHHKHHHHHRQDSKTSTTPRSESRISQGEPTYINGEPLERRDERRDSKSHRRRGSQSSQGSFAYARTDTLEPQARMVETGVGTIPQPQLSPQPLVVPPGMVQTGQVMTKSQVLPPGLMSQQAAPPCMVQQHVPPGMVQTVQPTPSQPIPFDRRSSSIKSSHHASLRGHHPDYLAHQPSHGGLHEGYTRDDYMVGLHSPEVAAIRYTQNMPDVSQITAVQVTPRPKPRSFPRTNPCYVGVQRRDGLQSYKKINIEEQLPPGIALEQRFFNDLPRPAEPRGYSQSPSSAAGQSYGADMGLRHERSDSDTSHSSYGRVRNEMTDSQISRISQGSTAVVTKLPREHSDSQSSKSSQGSLKNLQKNNSHSSQGSLGGRSSDKELSVDLTQDRQDANSVSSVGSGRNSVTKHRSDQTADHMDTLHEHTGSIDSGVEKTLQRRNSEPDYANLPVIAHIEGGKIMTIEQHVGKGKTRNTDTYTEDERLHDDFRSGDSLSPHEYSNRQDTPSSQRSAGNSSQTSEGLPDQGYDESEDSSVFSTPSPKTKARNGSSLPMETQHASLKRKKVPEKQEAVRTPTLEKSQSLQAELAQQRPLSLVLASQSEANVIINPNTGSLQRQTWPDPNGSPVSSFAALFRQHSKPNSDSDIQRYAQENFSKHRRGILRKKVSFLVMLMHSQDPIQKPMIRTNDKLVKKEAPETFKLIQMYMGDRKVKQPLPQIALDLINKGWAMTPLRDEIYIQLCRQTTENKRDESLLQGWELMGICLSFFSPSVKFHHYLEGYIYRHLDPACDTDKVPVSHLASHCQRRLEKIVQSGVKKGLKKPTLEEVEQAKKSIFHPSMFGSTLEDVMLLQKDRFPDRQLPWIQTTLSEEVLKLSGAQTEGIFRVPGDIDEVNALKVRCDQWQPPTNCPDPYIPASLLKLWYRELYEPLIPPEFYEQCISNYADADAAVEIVHKLPGINRLVISYLIRFLQVFAASENVSITKMDVNNLAMVMAPNCLRCESEDPKVIFENTRKEMAFMRTLIQNLDTSFMEGII